MGRNVPEWLRAWPPPFVGSTAEFVYVDQLPEAAFAFGRIFVRSVVSGQGLWP